MSFVRTGQNLNVQYRQLNGGFLSLRYLEIDDNCINFVRKFHIFCPPFQHCRHIITGNCSQHTAESDFHVSFQVKRIPSEDRKHLLRQVLT